MALHNTVSTSLRPADRLLAAAGYFGLAPYLARHAENGHRQFRRHHLAHALAFSLALLLVLLFALVMYILTWYLHSRHAALYESLRKSVVFWLATDASVRVLFLVWLIGWAGSILSALLGFELEMPFVRFLARTQEMDALILIASSPTYFIVLICFGVVFHASVLTDGAVRPASAYLLYDDLDAVPRWIFNVGFYRISRAATAAWGDGSVVVAPLTKEALNTALANGRVVFVASHGEEGRITMPGWTYGPEEARRAAGADLRLVYIAGCNAGRLAPQWREALAPAETITFARDSHVGEHVRWLWLQGPAKIRALPQ